MFNIYKDKLVLQTTIASPVSCYGIGVHSGRKTQLTLKPAKANTGILFIRSDITQVDNAIKATYDNVFETRLSTSIRNNATKIHISTIEHLMAALWGCGIHNVIVEVDGEEVPIMDGSSKPFVFMIECAGVLLLKEKQKSLKLLKDIHIQENGAEIFARPSNRSNIELSIDFDSPAIGKQQITFQESHKFKEEIADSRTFGFVRDLDYLLSKGLAKGASLDNTIGIENDKVINSGGLRYDNEFVRHKLLDLLGDLYSAGGNFIGEIKGHKTSHYLNNEFLRKIFSDQSAYEWR